MRSKKFILIFAVFALIFFSLNFVSAVADGNGYASTLDHIYINRSTITQINISITSDNLTASSNITFINITLPLGMSYISGSNYTNLFGINFSNWSATNNLIWNVTNASGSYNFDTNVTYNFIFNVTAPTHGDYNILINATRLSGTGNSSRLPIVVNFAFAGYIKNETGRAVNLTNVSMWLFGPSPSGPPIETMSARIRTTNESTGFFNFESLNGSIMNYKIKLEHYNTTNSLTKTGTILPPFPAGMYYPANPNWDISLNGSTFYLLPAATLRLNATNSSGAFIPFGYQVIDQKVGFPIASNIMGNESTWKDIAVPIGRNYSVMILRAPSQFMTAGNFGPQCDGKHLSSMNCSATPRTNASFGTLTEGEVKLITTNLTVTTQGIYGCINISAGASPDSNIINITTIVFRMVPFSTSSGKFIPPMRAEDAPVNITLAINYTTSQKMEINGSLNMSCAGNRAFYNFSLLGGGLDYVFEFYGKNVSEIPPAGEADSGGVYLAGFQNVTINAPHTQQNITLYALSGSYVTNNITGKEINTSMIKVNIKNSTGGAVTTSMHVEVSVKNSAAGIGTINYMVESLTNGTFYLPILNNSNWAEVSVYPDSSPPIVKSLNLSKTDNNITLVTISFASDGDKGIRQKNASGSLVAVNTSGMPFDITFYRLGTSSVITNMSGNNFNPLKALVAGNVDLEIKMRATNITMRFRNFDMFSAKQPPMFAVMDNNTLTSSAGREWTFGNFVPKNVYDNVSITIPYDNNTVNESWSFKMNISMLYEEDPNNVHQFKAAWNISAGDTANTLSDYFAAYNNSLYRNYLIGAGTTCDTNVASGAACIMNQTGDTFILELPHFSGLTPGVAGTASAAGTTTTSSSGSSSAGTTTQYWISTHIITDEQFKQGYTIERAVKERVKITIGKEDHYIGVTALTATTATINVSSTPQQATFLVGEEKKFDVTNDSYYDLSVKLNSIANSKASLTIKSIYEKIGVVKEPVEEKTPGEVIKETVKEIAEKVSSSKIAIASIIVIVIVVIALIIWLLAFRKKKKFYSW